LPNELPHLEKFRLRFAVDRHLWNARGAPRANLKFTCEAPSVQITSPGLAMLDEGGEHVVNASQGQSRVEIRRFHSDRFERSLHGHGLYTGKRIAFGTISNDNCRDSKEVRLEIPFRPITIGRGKRTREMGVVTRTYL